MLRIGGHDHSPLTSGSLCTIRQYVVSFFEAPPLAHGFGLFACHQYVCGIVLWGTTPCSRFRPLCVPSVCEWCRSLKHHPLLTVSASSRAISLYVVSFFEAPPLAHGFGLFAFHQDVRGVVLWSTTPCSRLRPLCVPSGCTCCRPLKHQPLLTVSASSRAISMYVVSFIEAPPLANGFGLFAFHQSVRGVVLWSTTPCSRFRPLRVPSGSTWCQFYEAPPLAHVSGLFAFHQYVRGVVLWSTTPCSRFRPLRVPSVCTWCRFLKHHPLLTVSASSRSISMYVLSCFEAPPLAHGFGLFAFHQGVRGVVLWNTAPCSRFRPLRVPSVGMWCRFWSTTPCSRFRPLRVPSGSTWCRSLKHATFAHGFGLFACHQYVRGVVLWSTTPCSRFRPLRVPSVCTWCRSLKHHPLLTVSASLRAISVYVLSFFEAPPLAHGFGLLAFHQFVRGVVLWSTTPCSRFRPLRVPSVCTWCHSLKHHLLLTVAASSRAIREYVVSFFEPPPLAHGFGLFACHQLVRGVVLWSTTPCSRFRPLRVPSVCTCCRSLKHHPLLTVSASSRAISLYVVLFFETPLLAHGYGLFAFHQNVRGVVLWNTTPCSRFRPLRVPSACTWCRSLKHHPLLTISASSRAIRLYVVSFEAPPVAHGFGLFACYQTVRAVGLWSTTRCSRFRPLRVPSGSTWCHSWKHHPLLTVAAPSRSISLYVVSFLKAPPVAHGFGLFVFHQIVCDVVLESTTRCSLTRLACTFCQYVRGVYLSIPNSCWQSPSLCAFREYVVSFSETLPLSYDFHAFVHQEVSIIDHHSCSIVFFADSMYFIVHLKSMSYMQACLPLVL